MWMILAELIVLMGSVYHIMSVLFNDKEKFISIFFQMDKEASELRLIQKKTLRQLTKVYDDYLSILTEEETTSLEGTSTNYYSSEFANQSRIPSPIRET